MVCVTFSEARFRRSETELLARQQFRTLLPAVAVALAFTAAADATPITSLFNTGVGASGVPAANLAPEAHYALTSVPATAATAARVATSANGFPIPPWLADDAVFAWIGPDSGGKLDLNGPTGNYTYETTFDLSGLAASTASISGQWSVDNTGVDILLNGVSTGQTAAGFQSFYAFNLATGFNTGLNTLDFIVHNDSGPTGLRVEMVGTADSTPVLEPASLALLGSGLFATALPRHKRA